MLCDDMIIKKYKVIFNIMIIELKLKCLINNIFTGLVTIGRRGIKTNAGLNPFFKMALNVFYFKYNYFFPLNFFFLYVI